MSGRGDAGRSGRPLALVTGGARRVGLATARELARAGCDLLITYRTSVDEAHAAAAELETMGACVQLEGIDLGDLGAVERLGERLAAELPRVDVFVHNASMYAPTPLDEVTAGVLMRHFSVNTASHVVLTRHLAPRLMQSALSGGGAIVAMCDVHAMGVSGRPRRNFLAYSLSKAALAEMVYVLARELAPRVRVNGVAPGVVAFAETGPDADPAMRKAYLSRVPLGRSGTPEEAARAVRWLALEATYVTGEVVRVDGGRWMG